MRISLRPRWTASLTVYSLNEWQLRERNDTTFAKFRFCFVNYYLFWRISQSIVFTWSKRMPKKVSAICCRKKLNPPWINLSFLSQYHCYSTYENFRCNSNDKKTISKLKTFSSENSWKSGLYGNRLRILTDGYTMHYAGWVTQLLWPPGPWLPVTLIIIGTYNFRNPVPVTTICNRE